MKKWIGVFVLFVAIGGISGLVYKGFQDHSNQPGTLSDKGKPVPVEVSAVHRGPIALHRTFTGSLEAHAQFVVSPKISGRVERLHVNLADKVIHGQVVAELDNGEYVQSLAQAKAQLAVANANLMEAKNLLEISNRDLRRFAELRKSNNVSESAYDTAKADALVKQARFEVSKAQLLQSKSGLEMSRIRLSYTKITANWRGGSKQRVVSELYVNEGETISANTPLIQIVELVPIVAVFFVTERDYDYLQPNQKALLTADAYPNENFKGIIKNIAPIFRENTRQARVELEVENPESRLKPGMFSRISIIVKRINEATIVPEQAITIRNGKAGLFMVNPDQKTVAWNDVQTGIRQEDKVQILKPELNGLVVTLGQQLLKNGSSVILVPTRSGDSL